MSKRSDQNNTHLSVGTVETEKDVLIAGGDIKVVRAQYAWSENFRRALFHFMFISAFVWVSILIFRDFESVPPEHRKIVVQADAWMFIPTAILFLAGVVSDKAFVSCLAVLREVLSAQQVGSVAIFSLSICSGLAVLWLFTAELQSKRTLADGIKFLLGAAIGAAIEHRVKAASQSNSKGVSSGPREP